MSQPQQPAVAAELSNFVRLHEGIKGVVLISFQINLMALNAILLAHRAGELALGFGVISKELRVLSTELTRQMRQVSHDSLRAVQLISQQLCLERRLLLLQATQRQLAHPSPRLQLVLQQREQACQQLRQQVREVRLQLLASLEETRNLCLFGTALSRSAKIEAAYGQSYQTALGEVSREFADKTQHILPSIEALCMEMKIR